MKRIILIGGAVFLAVCAYAHAAEVTIDTNYRPSTNGYHFQNFGHNVLVTIPIYNVEVPSAGNCYGFAARSVDHHHYGISIPENTTRTQEQEDDLIARQWDFSGELLFVAQQMGYDIIGINTMIGDYEWLKAKLQAGSPWPIFASGEPVAYSLVGTYPVIHSLVAYKIVENYQNVSGRHAIYLYDSNYPENDSIFAIVEPLNGTFTLSSGFQFSWFTTLRSYGPVSPATINDEFSTAITISGVNGETTGSNVEATKETGEPNHAGKLGGRSVWWQWTPSSSGEITIDTIGSDFDTVLGVYTGVSVGSLTHIASNDDASGLQSLVVFDAVSGTTYRIAVDGFNANSGNITLHWNLIVPRPANDAFTNAISVSGASGQTTGSNVDATKETGEPNHAGRTGGTSVWWKWQASSSGQVIIDTIGSNFDTVLAAYTGSSVGSLTNIQSNDDYSGLQSRITFDAVSGVLYFIAVDGYNGLSGNIVLNWEQERIITLGSPTFFLDEKVVIHWNSEEGVTYSINSSMNLHSGFGPLQEGIVATPPMNSFTDSINGVKQKFWYVNEEP